MRIMNLLARSGLLALVSAAVNEPKIHVTGFDHVPRKFSYFEDSPTILFLDERSGIVHISHDEGSSWDKISGVPDKLAQSLIMHPFNKKAAFLLGSESIHYRTMDQGKTWEKFETESSPSMLQAPLGFNAKNHNSIIYAGEHCDDKGGFWGTHCYDHSYYTEDAFATKPALLCKNTHACIFARSTDKFRESSQDLVLCIDEDNSSKRKFPMNLRLLSSSDYFRTQKEIVSDNGPIRGVVGLGAVQTFIVAATKAPGTDEMSLYVTDDGENWDLAEFPHDHRGLKEDAYTILESRPYGIQVDVMSSEIQYNSYGSLFTSNSNGTYFTRNLEYTNRNEIGIVDFENVQNIEGIVLANVVLNHAAVQRNRNVAKQLQSRISFNDGRTWQALRAPEDSECVSQTSDVCALHLYSAASPHNVGRIFSSTTPGLLMGVGSVGESLLPYAECDLFVSEDAGVTWRLSKKDAHKYEWGDQGSILVAVYDEDTTDKIYYSFNRGRDWKSVDLGSKIRARILTTVPDSTSEKFALVATRGRGEEDADANVQVFSLDFTGMRPRKCKLDKDNSKKSDFEKWYARYDAQGQPTCLMGHKQFFWRRKADVDCYVGDKYHDPEANEEDCPCEKDDFECDYNFVLVDDQCMPSSKDMFSKECSNSQKTFMGPSGYRLIPGNTCDRKRGLKFDDKVERSCAEASIPSADGRISASITDFDGHASQYFYLERSQGTSGDDETIIMQIDSETIYKSHDHGSTWSQILKGEEIVAIIPHKYFSDWVFFFTASSTAFLSKNRGRTIIEVQLPSAPNNMGRPILDFHPTKSDWLLFTGYKGCERSSGESCRAVSFYTEDGASSWDLLHDYVDSCQYIGATKVQADANLIYCAAYSTADRIGELSLFSSVDYFETTEQLFPSIVGFAVFEEFVIVAEVHDEAYLRFQASVDGETFAVGHFPAKFSVDQQQAYTVLDSVTKSIFLHVTTNPQAGREWGSILKSNSNGTYFVTSLDFVNRNSAGYVDFEKLMGLEGVAVANVVANSQAVSEEGVMKKLRTKSTHNDGGEWTYLTPPQKDSLGKDYDCSGNLEKCSLNLHGYTERADIRDTYSSGSAIGILLGVGNVGNDLTLYDVGNTFMSRDGGLTWLEAHKGPYQWEFGDQGAIIVIVKDGQPTDRVLYTLNEGQSWEEFVFAGEKLLVRDITTVPSDTSRKFLLYAKPDIPGDKMKTIALDFSGLTDRQCVLDEDETKANDFYKWVPSHPANEDKCLFGHVTEYHRKRPESLCYMGTKVDVVHKVLQNCSCTIYDFECDYNYQRAKDGTCQLIPGLDPPDHSAICAQSEAVSWTEPTGYRKVPLTTCQGGKELDGGFTHPCPGHEEEYRKGRKGLHGFWLFVVVCIPFVLAACIGMYVWNMHGGRTLGQIRLGDDTFDRELVNGRDKAQEIAVIVLSGLLTAVVSVPAIAKFCWKAIAARLGGRRGRSAYYQTLVDEPLLSDDEDPLDEDI